MAINENISARISAYDTMSPVLSRIKNQVLGVAGAYASWRTISEVVGNIIGEHSEYEASMTGINKLIQTTGRNGAQVYAEIQNQMTGLASKASIASTFLKGLTTELNPKQIGELTTAVRNASIAMGEDFNYQLPLIIKAVKQLNPAILDNIGVTVRLDRVNKMITQGYYGMNREINEATQQNAIFQEIIRQTAKFQGMEAEALNTTAGKMQKLKAQLSDLYVVLGEQLNPTTTTFIDTLSDLAAQATQTAIAIADTDNFFEKTAIFVGSLVSALSPLGYSFSGVTTTMLEAKNAAAAMNKENENASSIIKQEAKDVDELSRAWTSWLQTMSDSEQAETINMMYEKVIPMRQQIADDYIELVDDEIDAVDAATQEELEYQYWYYDATFQKALDTKRKKSELQSQWGAESRMHTKTLARGIVDLMSGADISLQTVYRRMASHFVEFFIDEALKSVEFSFIPKLLGFLGSIFDQRANDMMAQTQGRHFIQNMMIGASEELDVSDVGEMISNKIAKSFESEGGSLTGRII